MTNQTYETKFQIKYHHRYELRNWIRENFPWVEHNVGRDYLPNDLLVLEKRANEVIDACNQVEQIDLRSDSAYVDYYQNDWNSIRNAANRKDFLGLAKALDCLLAGIDWE
jgi:hypothetical protein